MIRVTPAIDLDEDELSFDFIRSPGPGGQHVNKASTTAQLQFDVAASSSLPQEVKDRLPRLAGKRLSEAGVLTITARRFRSRERNRQDALDRLLDLIRKAAEKPKPRKKTRVSRSARERRLSEKRRRSETKRSRGPIRGSDD